MDNRINLPRSKDNGQNDSKEPKEEKKMSFIGGHYEPPPLSQKSSTETRKKPNKRK